MRHHTVRELAGELERKSMVALPGAVPARALCDVGRAPRGAAKSRSGRVT